MLHCRKGNDVQDIPTDPFPPTYFIEKDGKTVLDWSNGTLKTDIADKCKYLFGDAYDDQKIK